MAATSDIYGKFLARFRLMDREIEENQEWKRKNLAISIPQNQKLLSKLDALSVPSVKALIIEARTAEQRRYWHQWAADRGFKNHHPTRTGHFEENYVHYCTECGTLNYGDELNYHNDYSDIEPDQIIGQYSTCNGTADYYCYNSSLHVTVGYNGVYITNGEVPHLSKRKLKRRGRKSVTEKSKIEFPITERCLSYKIIDLADI